MAECKMWGNMESKGVESKMERNFKLVLNDKTEKNILIIYIL